MCYSHQAEHRARVCWQCRVASGVYRGAAGWCTAQFGDIGYEVAISQLSDTEYLFTTQSLNADEYSALQAHITETIGEFEVKEYQSYSPSISQELLYKAVMALLAAVVIIIIYISLVFRKSSRPVASWKYGIAATFALLHDTIIPLGLFSNHCAIYHCERLIHCL